MKPALSLTISEGVRHLITTSLFDAPPGREVSCTHILSSRRWIACQKKGAGEGIRRAVARTERADYGSECAGRQSAVRAQKRPLAGFFRQRPVCYLNQDKRSGRSISAVRIATTITIVRCVPGFNPGGFGSSGRFVQPSGLSLHIAISITNFRIGLHIAGAKFSLI